LRPGLVRLADEDDVDEIPEIGLPNGNPRAADHHEHAPVLELGEDLPHAVTLDVHPGKADDVGARAAVEVDRLHVLVDQGDAVVRRRERGEQRQAGDRQYRLSAKQPQCVIHAPIRGREARMDQHDVGHSRGSCGSCEKIGRGTARNFL